MNSTKKHNLIFTVIAFAVFTVLCLSIGFLTVKNKKLESRLEELTRPVKTEQLQPGDIVPPVNLLALDGSTVDFNYFDTTKYYLLFVLSTTCPHCENTLSKWKSIVDQYHGEDDIITAISTNDLEQSRKYNDDKKLSFNLFIAADTSFSRLYKIHSVPQTVLIDNHRKVVKVWIGELTVEHVQEIEKHLGGTISSGNL